MSHEAKILIAGNPCSDRHAQFQLEIERVLQITHFSPLSLQLACRIVSIATHYFLSASFCWMLAEGIHIYNKIVRVFSNKKYSRVFYVLGWGKIIKNSLRELLSMAECYPLILN